MTRVHRIASIAAACVVVITTALSAHTQSPASTTASIRGTVADAAGRPASGIVVVLFSSDESQWSGADSATRVRRADVVAGRFGFANLPAGNYKIAFVLEAMLADWPSAGTLSRLSARKPAPMPLELEAGEEVTMDATVNVTASDVRFDNARMAKGGTIERTTMGSLNGLPSTLPAGRAQPPRPPAPTYPGAISGRVTDADGKPVAGIEVRSMRPVTIGGVLQLASFGQSVTTDADGRYLLPSRGPGDYIVAVPAFSIDIRTGNTIQRAPAPGAGPEGSLLGYVTTYHGGAIDPRIAKPVRVAAVEVSGIDVQLIRRRMYDVNGSVQGLPLTSQRQYVTLVPIENPEVMNTLNLRRIALSDTGSFTIAGVPDGEYDLMFSSPMEGWAQERVRVAGRSPAAMSLTMRPVMIVTGRLEFQGSSPAPENIPQSPQYTIQLAPAQNIPGVSYSSFPVGRGGTFTARGTGPGPFRLRGTVPAPWIQVAGLVGGVDTLDAPIPAGANTDTGLIIFADRQSSLLVKVTDDADRPAPEVAVLVFSEDTRYWSVPSRRRQSAQTLASGAASLSNLPPGKYLVLATRELNANDPITPQILERLKSRALPFELAAGESRSLQVRVR